MPIHSALPAAIPAELLIHIALDLVLLDAPLGPPAQLLPLLLTCRHIYNTLSFPACSQLYARIFQAQFDSSAARRRIGPRADETPALAAQLKAHHIALKRIRHANVDSDSLESDFWIAWTMCLENDGKNEAHLRWAGLHPFVDRFLRTRLWEGREDFGGWPAESTLNALAVWLYWYTLDKDTLAAQSRVQRSEILNLIRPYVLAAPRYASFYAPDNHFWFPLPADISDSTAHALVTPHGFYPMYRDPEQCLETIRHYNENIDIAPPLIAQGAKLLYMTLNELPFSVPRDIPIDREHADQTGRTYVSPTQADLIEANAHTSVKLLEPGDWDWKNKLTEEELRLENKGCWTKGLASKSAMWDCDWNRMISCGDPYYVNPRLKVPTYEYGVLSGAWQGRMLIPDVNQYCALISSQDMPATLSAHDPALYVLPVYMTLREHHCIMPQLPVRTGGAYTEEDDDGINNGWFPEIQVRETAGRVHVRDTALREDSQYETYAEGRENSHDPETCTACIMRGESEETELRATIAANADAARGDDAAMDVEQTRAEVDAALGPGVRVDDLLDVEMDGGESVCSDYVNNTCSGICDIIITGEVRPPSLSPAAGDVLTPAVFAQTLPRHGQAWNHFRVYGRVRSWDGLVALVRVPAHVPELGVYIFRGYVVAGNLVGSWRCRTDNIRAIPLEGPFVVSRA
ncbi:uncharacterized protein FIBRA_04721 [Fibroporia radiculosa]|uniref:F-box domain-containing protein n=1 Tax=Fibroporia radiculosa TaxID=599839 RepID=J4G7U7_9APHY|nr:uncharacterized protein FIBRA_04721 [Fibroporia radiculosa]CCM02618.1 predicted protein [Fibroporia radiculosa]